METRAQGEIHNLDLQVRGADGCDASSSVRERPGRSSVQLVDSSFAPDGLSPHHHSRPEGGGDGLADLSLDALACLSGVGSQGLEPRVQTPSAFESTFVTLECSICADAGEVWTSLETDRSAGGDTVTTTSAADQSSESHGDSTKDPAEATETELQPVMQESAQPGSELIPTARVLAWARFLQHIYRRSVAVKPGCWTRGGLNKLAIWRPTRAPACAHGLNLADPLAWVKQREITAKCMRWYSQYTTLLKRFKSGMAPLMLDICCSAGGASEGARRAGAEVMGVDIEPQLYYSARFGEEAFILHDAFDMEHLRYLVRKFKPFLVWASPPCQGYSTAPNVGTASKVARLIPIIRAMLEELGVLFVIENVTGARVDMDGALPVWGQLFGLHQDRERLLYGGGGLELRHEEALAEPGRRLREQSCLGRRRRFPRRDPFGRLVDPKGPRVCCNGNIFATQGASSHFGSVAEHADSMGLDAGHMDYKHLSQAIPPAYATYVVGQAAMHTLKSSFGLPVISFDEMLQDETRARAMMRHWLEGAGAASPSSGLAFVDAGVARVESGSTSHDPMPDADVWPTRDSTQLEVSAHWSIVESDFRELDYTHAGGYDSVVIHGDAPNWSARLRPCHRVELNSLSAGAGTRTFENTLIHLPGEGESQAVERVCKLSTKFTGRVTVIVDARWAHQLEAHGFRRVLSWAKGTRVLNGDRAHGELGRRAVALSIGCRECMPGGLYMDHEAVRPFMDPRDRGHASGSSASKAALAWSPLKLHPDRWEGRGLPRDVELMMKEGVTVDAVGDDELWAHENPQYRFKDGEHFIRGALECDRALLAGHLEIVPESEAEWALRHGSVHPWTVVHH